MPQLVIGVLQAIEIDNDRRNRPERAALQPVQLIRIEGAVVQLGQHIVLAEIFEIGFSLLARGNVRQRHLHQRPVVLMARENGKMQENVPLRTVKRIIHHLAMVVEIAVPKLHQLFAERLFHLAAENIAKPLQQNLPVRRAEQVERRAVDVDDANFAHALPHEFGMNIHEHAEIDDAALPDLLDQSPHPAEIFHPQGNGRMFEHAFGVTAVETLLAAGLLPLRHILGGQKQPPECFFVAGDDRTAQLNIQPLAAD
ncbi:hypothetical protein D3C86_1335180 [compost metagenome]